MVGHSLKFNFWLKLPSPSPLHILCHLIMPYHTCYECHSNWYTNENCCLETHTKKELLFVDCCPFINLPFYIFRAKSVHYIGPCWKYNSGESIKQNNTKSLYVCSFCVWVHSISYVFSCWNIVNILDDCSFVLIVVTKHKQAKSENNKEQNKRVTCYVFMRENV